MSERRFHVFVERPRSSAPGATEELAQAISQRFGVPAADVTARLAAGRFRVKANVDRATAESYAAHLTALGAVCSVAAVAAARAPTPPPVAPSRPPAPARAPTPAPPPRRAATPPPEPIPLDDPHDTGGGLGALSGSVPLQLSTLDGVDDRGGGGGRDQGGMMPASFGPPAGGGEPDAIEILPDALPASFGPPPEPAASPASFGGGTDSPPPTFGGAPEAFDGSFDNASDPPLETADPFAPPEAALDTMVDASFEVDRPPPRAAAASSMAAGPGLGYQAEPLPDDEAAPARRRLEPVWRTYLRDQRIRFVAGAILASLVGFIPATIITSVREASAFAEIDAQLERQSHPVTRAEWDDLDAVRAAFEKRKQADRQSIAVGSLLIWAGLAAGFAWLWFRRLDWDRIAGPPPTPPEAEL